MIEVDQIQEELAALKTQISALRGENKVLRNELLGTGKIRFPQNSPEDIVDSKTIRELLEELHDLETRRRVTEAEKESDATNLIVLGESPSSSSTVISNPVIMAKADEILIPAIMDIWTKEEEETFLEEELQRSVRNAPSLVEGETLRNKTFNELFSALAHNPGFSMNVLIGNHSCSPISLIQSSVTQGATYGFQPPKTVQNQSKDMFSVYHRDLEGYIRCEMLYYFLGTDVYLYSIFRLYENSQISMRAVFTTTGNLKLIYNHLETSIICETRQDITRFSGINHFSKRVIRADNFIAVLSMSPGPKAWVDVQIYQRKPMTFDLDLTLTQSQADVRFILVNQKFLSPNPAEEVFATISGDVKRAVAVDITNVLFTPLHNGRSIFRDETSTNLDVPQLIRACGRNVFLATAKHDRVHFTFKYEIFSSDLQLIVHLHSCKTRYNIALTFATTTQVLEGDFLTNLEEDIDWKTRVNKRILKIYSQQSSSAVIEARNVRVWASLNASEKPVLKILVFSV